MSRPVVTSPTPRVSGQACAAPVKPRASVRSHRAAPPRLLIPVGRVGCPLERHSASWSPSVDLAGGARCPAADLQRARSCCRVPGRCPIAWAIMRGDRETGITTFQRRGCNRGDAPHCLEPSGGGDVGRAGGAAGHARRDLLIYTLTRLDALTEAQRHDDATMAPRLKKTAGRSVTRTARRIATDASGTGPSRRPARRSARSAFAVSSLRCATPPTGTLSRRRHACPWRAGWSRAAIEVPGEPSVVAWAISARRAARRRRALFLAVISPARPCAAPCSCA